ncbi:NfeD family protein [Mixta hanseatica]|uniref:NfeD family protein n=1 Tax=Mixta hanseatica TaxID=2872648 RepID=A0ABY4RAA5_9GAMM|nr:NfeD family protein [Mixta hanseatica]UQY45258.1 NfeD family protein [Mixta hanseatica]
MLAAVINQPHWFWLTLGGLLLIAEMLGTSGYLLWSGLAALAVGLIRWMLPFSWGTQGILFALLTLLAAFLWYRWLALRQKQPGMLLNQRGMQMTGMQLTLDEDLVNGLGHVRVGDSSWRVQADNDLPAGTRVVVICVEGVTLRIRPQDAETPGR